MERQERGQSTSYYILETRADTDMAEKGNITSLIREAEVYRAQGLLEESKKTYLRVLGFIQNDASHSKNEDLIDAVREKIKAVEKDLLESEQVADIPDLSEELQALIRKLFSFSKNKEVAAIEGAAALAKFGQYERALEEFQSLINKGTLINVDGKMGHVSAQFNTIIKELSESYKHIREQSALLFRYAKEISESYKKMKDQEELRDNLSRYVGKNLVEKLIKSRGKQFFENERREVTVLFADIRSFTALSEKMPAEEVVSMLNEYFGTMVEIIFKHDGILDKFVGDQIMAVFGILPAQDVPPYDEAIKAAIDMQNATRSLMAIRSQRGNAVFEIGIGINTGEAIVGNVGSRNRMGYTVIGDCVNVAGRLQMLAKGNEIIIGEQTYLKTQGRFRTKKRGVAKLKNRAEPVKCYEVME
jgi:adenylate cyclase